MCACQILAADLLGQAQQLVRCEAVPLGQRAVAGYQLAEQLASHGRALLDGQTPQAAISMLDTSLAQISELELDADDPGFDHLSTNAGNLNVKVRAEMAAICETCCIHRALHPPEAASYDGIQSLLAAVSIAVC